MLDQWLITLKEPNFKQANLSLSLNIHNFKNQRNVEKTQS